MRIFSKLFVFIVYVYCNTFSSYELISVSIVVYYIRFKAFLFGYLTLSLRVSLTRGGYVGVFITWRTLYALRGCGAPRKRCCARTRSLCKCARAARMICVRDARCASLLVCAWLQSPRAQRTLALPI